LLSTSFPSFCKLFFHRLTAAAAAAMAPGLFLKPRKEVKESEIDQSEAQPWTTRLRPRNNTKSL